MARTGVQVTQAKASMSRGEARNRREGLEDRLHEYEHDEQYRC